MKRLWNCWKLGLKSLKISEWDLPYKTDRTSAKQYPKSGHPQVPLKLNWHFIKLTVMIFTSSIFGVFLIKLMEWLKKLIKINIQIDEDAIVWRNIISVQPARKGQPRKNDTALWKNRRTWRVKSWKEPKSDAYLKKNWLI